MPDITAAGTYDKTDAGFEFLGAVAGVEMVLLFAGSTLPTTLEVKYTDDQGVDRTFENGTITALPTSFVIGPLDRAMKIVATGGSPDFNVTYGGCKRF